MRPMLIRCAMLAAVSALALSACKKADAPGSQSHVQSELAQARTPQAGEYTAEIKFLDFNIPGMPPEAVAQARASMESATAVNRAYCVTEEQARKTQQDRLREMSRASGDCHFTQFEVDGDNVDAKLSCNGVPGGGTAEMTMQGTMGTTASDMRISTHMTNPANPSQQATISMRVKTQRTGECSAATRAEAEQAARAAPQAEQNAR